MLLATTTVSPLVYVIFSPLSVPVLNIPDMLITCITLPVIFLIVPVTVLFSCPITSPTLTFTGKLLAKVISTGMLGTFTGSST